MRVSPHGSVYESVEFPYRIRLAGRSLTQLLASQTMRAKDPAGATSRNLAQRFGDFATPITDGANVSPARRRATWRNVLAVSTFGPNPCKSVCIRG